jgi:hypothetical protein
MIKIPLLMFCLLLSSAIFSEPEECCFPDEMVSEVIIIDILNPPFYSGRLLTYYTIIAYNDNGFDIFYYMCIGDGDSLLYEDDIRKLDLEKGKKYKFHYIRCNINGIVHNWLGINRNVNNLIYYQKIDGEDTMI